MKGSRTNTIALILLLLCGCARAPSAPERRPVPSTEDYYSRALDFERNDEVELALENFQTAGSLDPQNDEISRKIKEVQARIRSQAEEHFKKGLFYFEEKSFDRARREFLIALRLDPDQQQALDYLKNVLPGKEYTEYRVGDKETLREISRAVYGDPKMEFLIASFNDIDLNAKLSPGTNLKLPILEPNLMSQITDRDKELQRAEMLFHEKKYEQAISVAKHLLESDPTSEQAAGLINASYYEMGKEYRRQGKYRKSLEMFNNVAPEYKDVQQFIDGVKRETEIAAEEHYRRGVKFFINEQLEKAVAEWEMTLALNPDHKKAKADIEETLNLLEKLKTVK